MKKYILFLLLITFSSHGGAGEFDEIDRYIGSAFLDVISGNTKTSKVTTKKDCQFSISFSINKLVRCKKHIDSIYVTDDIDAFTSYIKMATELGVELDSIPQYSLVLSAYYDEVNSKLFYDLGKIYYQQGRYKESLMFLKKIDDTLDDNSVYDALLIYGLIYFEKGDYKRSQTYLERINESSDEYIHSKYNLGLIGMSSSWWSEAEQHLMDAINAFKLDKMSDQQSLLLDKIYLTLGYSQLNRKDFRHSRQSFSKISLNSEIKDRALLGIAMSEIGLGNLSKAAPLLKHLLTFDNSNVYFDALVILPQVYQHAGNIKKTVEYYQSAITKLKQYKHTSLNNFKINDTWFSSEFEKRKSRLADIRNISDDNPVIIKKLKTANHLLMSLSNGRLKNYNKQLAIKIDNYIKQSKYALAIIYDNSVVSR